MLFPFAGDGNGDTPMASIKSSVFVALMLIVLLLFAASPVLARGGGYYTSAGSYANDGNVGRGQSSGQHRGSFVDADGDGICDNYHAGGKNMQRKNNQKGGSGSGNLQRHRNGRN